jgi:membrane-bound ClpP family serine protease
MNFKKIMEDKGIGFWIGVGGVTLMLISFIFLLVTGKAQGDLSGKILALVILGIIVELVSLFFDFFSIAALAGTILFICGVMLLVAGRLEMIGLILNGVVTEKISAAFVLMWITGLIGVILNCAVAFIGTEKKAPAEKIEQPKAV